MSKKTILILSLILILVFVAVTAFSRDLKTVTYDVKSSKVQNTVKIALVTDLHSCYYGQNQSELFDKIDEYKPDAVLLGGDIFDDILDEENAQILIDRLAGKYKAYYVSGNHEWWSGRMYEFFDYLNSRGVKVLRGESDSIKVGDSVVNICGIDDPEVDRYDPTYTRWEEQLDKAGKTLDSGTLNILLSHHPERIDDYSKYGFDVIVSGHAHGGQFRIPFILNGFYAPDQGFLPEYAGGVYDIDGKKMIVSRGLSRENTWLPRIYNRPELVLVNIRTD